MTEMLTRAGISVAAPLVTFIEQRALPGTGVTADHFWKGMADVLGRFAPENRALLAERDRLQARLDEWHKANRGPIDAAKYQ